MWNIIFITAVFFTAVLFIWAIINLLSQLLTQVNSAVADNPTFDTVKAYIGQYKYLNSMWFVILLIGIFVGGMYLFKNPIPALAACVMLGIIPSHLMYSKDRQRRDKVLEQFAVALRIFTGEYSATKQINHGLRKVGEKVPNPVGEIFRETCSLLILGVTPDKAYKQMAQKLNISYAHIFASLLSQAERQGAGILPILDDLTKKVQVEQKLNKDNKIEIYGDRYIGLCLSFMPLPVFLILQRAYPETASFLTHTIIGRTIVTLSFAAVIIWFLLDRVLTE